MKAFAHVVIFFLSVIKGVYLVQQKDYHTHFDFIAWVCLFPPCWALNMYLNAKRRAITERTQSIEDEKSDNDIAIAIWIIIGIILF